MSLAAAAVVPTIARAGDGGASHSAIGPCAMCDGGLHEPDAPGVASARLAGRWGTTYTNGGGLTQGTPTTIHWSIVPDGALITAAYPTRGEVTGGSDLIANLDVQFGIVGGGSDLTTRDWFPLFSSSFDRWSQVAGLDYQYVSDDGVDMSGANVGSATRGDVRIGGHNIDGGAGILAYNYYPDVGDMVIDTSDIGFFSNATNNYRAGRNIVMHEHGHGMGIAHVESTDGSFLMEPFINTSFDGPQFDDILAAQRHYGDALEKNGGNDTAATAYDFGTIASEATVSIGFDAADTVVAATDVSFVSIDDETDTDFYRFTLDAQTGVTIDLTPLGPTYSEGAQGGTQSPYVTSAFSDLTLALLDSDGSTILEFANATGLGGVERILFEDLAAGTYFVQAAGLTPDWTQMYQLDVTAAVPEPSAALALLLGGASMLAMRRRRAA